MQYFNILIRLEKIIFNNKFHNSLLDVLLLHNLPISFQCRLGFCGICRIKLLSGKVKYFYEPLAYISNKEILSCCCKPISHLELDFQ